MSRRSWTTAPLLLLMLATGGWLSYEVVRSVASNAAVTRLAADVFSEQAYPPAADALPGAVAKVRREYDKHGGWRLGLMLHDLLLLQAWHEPEDSTKALQEALQLGDKYYRDVMQLGQDGTEYVGVTLAWAYLYAGLPQRVETWGKSFEAGAPAVHDSMLLLRLDAALMRDDRALARQLADAEIAKVRPGGSAQPAAVAACIALGDYAQAREYAQGLQYSPAMDRLVKVYYVQYLLHEHKFDEANRVAAEINGAKPDADDALMLALVTAAAEGVDDPAVAKLLEQGTRSTRAPRSLAGARAWLMAALYAYTGEEALAAGVASSLAQHPANYDVVCAAVNISLQQMADGYYDAAGQPFAKPQLQPLPAGWPALEQLMPRLLALADAPGRKQEAHLLAALALCYAARERAFDSSTLQRAADELGLALGDPLLAGSVQTQRPVDFGFLLIEPVISEARRSNPEFDAAVNKALIDYLNRRRALFTVLDPGPQLVYHDASSGVVGTK